MVVASPDDLVSAVARDRRMVGYRVRRQGEGWIELDVPAHKARTGADVYLVLAWPEVWRDEAALAPHLIRARAGNYGLILVGADPELEEARLDGQPGDTDLTALNAKLSAAGQSPITAPASRARRRG